MSWTTDHTHYVVLKDKYFKLFLFKIFVLNNILAQLKCDFNLTSLPADLDHHLEFLQTNQAYFQPEQIHQYQQQLKSMINSDIVIPISDKLASLAMPATGRF